MTLYIKDSGNKDSINMTLYVKDSDNKDSMFIKNINEISMIYCTPTDDNTYILYIKYKNSHKKELYVKESFFENLSFQLSNIANGLYFKHEQNVLWVNTDDLGEFYSIKCDTNLYLVTFVFSENTEHVIEIGEDVFDKLNVKLKLSFGISVSLMDTKPEP